MSFRRAALAVLMLLALAGGAWGPAAAQSAPAAADGPPLSIARQGSFFVGGKDVHSDALSTLPAYLPEGTVTVDQMYVHYQVPTAAGHHYPLTLIHGCCLTGKTWETTPDGRMGWDEFFLRRGYPVYLIDQAWRGRSATGPMAINQVRTGKSQVTDLPTVFFAGHEGSWAVFRFGPKYGETFPGMQYPLDAQSEFFKQMVPDWFGSLPIPNPTVPDLSALAEKLDGTILMSHSQSGVYPFQTAVLSRKGIAGIVSIEPGECPKTTDDMKPYAGLPILVLFGDFVELSPRWAPRFKMCQDFVKAANAAGGKAELIHLPEIGIHGNTHMLMQDRNSLQVAALLDNWMAKHIGQKK